MKKKILIGVGIIGLATAAFALVNSGYPFASGSFFGYGPKRNTIQFIVAAPANGSSSSFLPGLNNTNALGSTTLRFSNVFTQLLNVAGTVTMTGNEVTSAQNIFSPGAAISMAFSTNTMTPTSTYQLVGSTGAITPTATPIIATATATNGQWLILDSTAAVITLTDTASPAGTNSGLCLQAATVALTTSTPVGFIYNSTAACWKQIK